MKPTYKLNFDLLFECDRGTAAQLVKEILHYVNFALLPKAFHCRSEFLQLAEAILDPKAKQSLFDYYSNRPAFTLLYPKTLFLPRAKILQHLKWIRDHADSCLYKYSLLQNAYCPY